MTQQPFIVVFALFEDLTQLDFTGPWEVLTRLPGARVIVASSDGGEVRAQNGLIFAGTSRLADVDACDLVCVPGGPGTAAAMLDQAFLAEIRRLAAGARYITSVCTGSLVLAAAGLLQGRRAACHWASRHFLAELGATAVADRVVKDGRVITGGGVTAGIDFALAVAADVAGRECAEFIQLGLEYAPAPPFASGTPETASPELVSRYQELSRAWTEDRAKAVRSAADELARARGNA